MPQVHFWWEADFDKQFPMLSSEQSGVKEFIRQLLLDYMAGKCPLK